MTITSWVFKDFVGFSAHFDSDFTRFSNFNNFSNFEATNFSDHLNESPGSPLSYFSNYMGLTSVKQKILWGRKLQKMWKSLKSEDRRINKIYKKMCDFENLYFFYKIYIVIYHLTIFQYTGSVF